MNRRGFFTAVGMLPFTRMDFARAQQGRVRRLGILTVGRSETFLKIFFEGLGALGYSEGRNIEVVRRTADGRMDRLGALAEELVRLQVEIIVASETPAVQRRNKLRAKSRS